jgi:hypothetical protein
VTLHSVENVGFFLTLEFHIKPETGDRIRFLGRERVAEFRFPGVVILPVFAFGKLALRQR